MPSRLIASPTSLRLMGGFLAVLAIFAAAAALSWYNFDRIVATTAESGRGQEGLESVLRLHNLALQLDLVEANLAVGGDLSNIEPCYEVLQQMTAERQRLVRLVGPGKGQELLARCEASQQEIETVFRYRLVPALMADDTEAIIEERAAAARSFDQIIRVSEQLKRGFELRIAQANARADDIRRHTLTYSSWLLFAAVVVAVAVALLASRSVVKPIHELMEATQAVARGDWSRRLAETRRDEFGRLAASFNRMTTDLKAQQQRVLQAEKMASIGGLSAAVAHEINNPIGVILGCTKMLRASATFSAEAAEDLRAIEEEAEECKEVVQGLLNLSRAVPPAETVIDMRRLMEESLVRMAPYAERAGVAVEHEFADEPMPVRAEGVRLRQVVRNLVRNAFEAMEPGGRLRLRLQRLSLPVAASDSLQLRGQYVELEIADDGCGIAEANLPHLFEPFFSTKSNGTGLGLAIVQNVVRAYGGTIDVYSKPGEGTTFWLRLPLVEPVAEPAANRLNAKEA